MTELTGSSLSAFMLRKAFASRVRLAALRNRTAKRRLEYAALSASIKLFEPGAFVPWVSYLFPPELLASYGLTPLIPELAAATLTSEPFRSRVEAQLNSSGLSRDVCSYHRTALAALDAAMLPEPSLCLGTTPLCLGKELLLDSLARRYQVPFHEVRVSLPPDDGPLTQEAVAEVADDLRETHELIGRVSGRKPKLDRAVALSNRAALVWDRVCAKRRDGALLLNGREMFSFVFLGQIVWGTKAGAVGFEALESGKGRKDLEFPPLLAGAERKKLLWLHTVPHHDDSVFRLIEERGGAVVFEEMGQMHEEVLDAADPFPALARRLLTHPLWGSSSRRARLAVDLTRVIGADGVIHFNHWGCRHGLGSVPVLREAFTRAGIPFLALDGDALAAGSEQGHRALDQVESFLELLPENNHSRP